MVKEKLDGNRAQWSSRLAFILAASGSAVGLGNIWKFPYITGVNGGGAFVLVYLACIAVVGLPLLIAELMIGRRGAAAPDESFRRLAVANGKSPAWRWAGSTGILAAFLILSFYSVVGGWCVSYVMQAFDGSLADADGQRVQLLFDELLASPWRQVGWHTAFMGMTVLVVARGLNRGIERLINLLMPTLFLLLLALVAYAATTPGFERAVRFLFAPDFSHLTMRGVLVALGHAFFSLSLGMAVMIAYGSYLRRGVSLPRAALTIGLIDTAVALLAGIAIFSVVFSTPGLEPGAGPGLVFQTVPLAFEAMAGGRWVGFLFFLLLLFAAWSSSISVMEPVVERLENLPYFNRRSASWAVAAATWTIGVFCALSFNVMSGATIGGKGLFDLLDAITSTVLLPLAGLGVSIFVGWHLSRETSTAELGNATLHQLWRWTLRYLTPLLMAAVLAFNLFTLMAP